MTSIEALVDLVLSQECFVKWNSRGPSERFDVLSLDDFQCIPSDRSHPIEYDPTRMVDGRLSCNLFYGCVNPTSPDAALTELCTKHDEWLKELLAQGFKCSVRALKHIDDDDDKAVQTKDNIAWRNPPKAEGWTTQRNVLPRKLHESRPADKDI